MFDRTYPRFAPLLFLLPRSGDGGSCAVATILRNRIDWIFGMTGELFLASGSAARAEMLRRAGVPHRIVPAPVDEDALKAALRADGAPPRDVSDALAEAKAMRVSAKVPGNLVLGADQVLALDDAMLDKPRDRDDARAQLIRLRGRRHMLHSAAVICEDGRPVWRHVATARLHVRAFSDAFLDAYIDQHGDRLFETVGAYRLEDGGAPLFDRVDGDHFVVMGLPLLETLAYLRQRGICQA